MATSFDNVELKSSTATTQSAGDNSTKVATTAYVDTAAGATVTSATGTANQINVSSSTGDVTFSLASSVLSSLTLADSALQSGDNVSELVNDAGYLTTISGGDHGTLSGLGDDDHTQYALLAGRSGGQTLIGGTASGNDLTLQSTSNATKGSIIFGAAGNSVYDEVNDRLGIGKADPTGRLHVGAFNSSSNTIYMDSATANTNAVVYLHGGTGRFTVGLQGSASDQYRVRNFGTGATLFAIDRSTSKVGVLETSPSSELSVAGGLAVGSTYSSTVTAGDGEGAFESNIVIGNTAGNYLLHLNDSSGNSPAMQFTNGNTGVASNVGMIIGLLNNQDFRFQLIENSDIYFSTNNTTRLRITNTGNVGIGTDSPTGNLQIEKSSPTIYLTQSTGAGDQRIVFDQDPNFWTIGRDNTYNTFSIDWGTSLTSTMFAIKNDGKVGFSEVAPSSLVSIAGGLAVGSTYSSTVTAGDGEAFFEGDVGIGATTASYPLSIGYNAGDFQIGLARSDGGQNARIGVNSSSQLVIQNGSGGANTRFLINSGDFYFTDVDTTGAQTPTIFIGNESATGGGGEVSFADANSGSFNNRFRIGLIEDNKARISWTGSSTQDFEFYTLQGNLKFQRFNGSSVFDFMTVTGTTNHVLYVQGKTGIAETSPSSLLSLAGGLAVGSTYSSTVTAGDGDAYFEGQTVIGQTSPRLTNDLTVAGNIAIATGGGSTPQAFDIGSGGMFLGQVNGSGVITSAFAAKGIFLQRQSDSSNNTYFDYDGTGNNYIGALGGNTGFKETSPSSDLSVAGGLAVGSTYSSTVTAGDGDAYFESSVSVGTTSTTYKLNTVGGHVQFERDSFIDLNLYGSDSAPNASVAVNIKFKSTDDLSAEREYARIVCFKDDVTNTSIDGSLYFQTAENNTLANSMVIVGRDVGIGESAPANILDVAAGMVVGSTYSGTNTAPTNGLLVEGQLGLGVTTTNAKLHIGYSTAQVILERSDGNDSGVISFDANNFVNFSNNSGNRGFEFSVNTASGTSGVVFSDLASSIYFSSNRIQTLISEGDFSVEADDFFVKAGDSHFGLTDGTKLIHAQDTTVGECVGLFTSGADFGSMSDNHLSLRYINSSTTTYEPIIQAIGAGGAVSEIASIGVLQADVDVQTAGAILNLYSTRSSAAQIVSGTRTSLASGDIMGAVRFGGDTGSNMCSGATIDAVVNGTPLGTQINSDLRFNTVGTLSNIPTTIMTVGSNAKVGIGIAASSADGKFHVASSSTEDQPVMVFEQNDSGTELFKIDVPVIGALSGFTVCSLNNSGATTDHIKIDINGTDYWIAVSSNAPT